MKIVTYRVSGRLLGGDGRFALLLLDDQPEKEGPDLIYLRYPFVSLGLETLIFPAFILDDWGSEIKSVGLYEWFAEFGAQFPRAEVFGLDENGRETQRFVRELEQYSKLPCLAFANLKTPLADGNLVEAILLPDDASGSPVKIKRPSWVKRPLRSAKVSWWQVHPATTTFDFP